MKSIVVTFKVYPEEGQFTAICPELDVATCGDTPDEALRAIQDAVVVDLNSLDSIGELHRFLEERGIAVHDEPLEEETSPEFSVHVGEVITRQAVPVPV